MVDVDPELAAIHRNGPVDVLDPFQRRMIGRKTRRLEVPFTHPVDLRIFAREAGAMLHDIEAICSTGNPDNYRVLHNALHRYEEFRAKTAMSKVLRRVK